MGHPSLDLKSKVAVVIGGTSGIGLTLAKGLAEPGADVVATGRRADLVRSAAHEIRSLGRRSLEAPSDVTDRSSIEARLSAVETQTGELHILPNSASITHLTA